MKLLCLPQTSILFSVMNNTTTCNEQTNTAMTEACSALLALLPLCDERDNGESWGREMVLCEAIACKNTWFWRTGDPWIGGIAELIHDLAIPADWVQWRGDSTALIRIGNVTGALTYVRDSRYEGFALAWPPPSDPSED